MRTSVLSGLALLAALAAGPLQARDTDMLVLPPATVRLAEAPPIEPADMKRAIVQAGARRGWTLRGESAGALTLGYWKGSKHEVVVDVAYDGRRYEIRFVSSHNMNQGLENGRVQIHPNYNRWLLNLDKDIREEIARLPLPSTPTSP